MSGDLNARVRVEKAAPQGTEVQARAVLGRPDDTVRLVILDLDAGGDTLISEVESMASEMDDVRWIGYFSHIDENLKHQAARAGIDAVPRGRFWRQLAEFVT